MTSKRMAQKQTPVTTLQMMKMSQTMDHLTKTATTKPKMNCLMETMMKKNLKNQ